MIAAGITRANANIMISTRHTSVVGHDRPRESTRTIGKNDYRVNHCGMHVLGSYRCFLALVILRASAVVGQTPPGLVDARVCRISASAVQSLHTADGRPAYVEAPVGYGDERTFTVTGAPAWEWYSQTSVMPLQPTDSASVRTFAYSSGSFQPVALPSATAASAPQWITLGTKAALLWGDTRADVQGGDSPVTQLSRFSARCSR